MAFDITPYIDKKPSEVRKLIREGVIDFPTAGMCRGYAQANLIILPPEYAGDFEEFAKRNPFPCPILEIIRGTPETHDMGEGGNICTDIPKYRIYRDGKWDGKELTDVSDYWKEGYVGFLIGCSFSFEETLMREGIEIRHIAQGRNVPMFKTNIMTEPAGPFCGPMVCSMRPMTPENAKKAYDITVKMPNVHGAPVHMGDAAEVGVADVMRPDYGEAVDFYEGEIPVFWPCGVTPQAAVENAKPPIAITHAPGHMFITDIINSELNDYLEAKKESLNSLFSHQRIKNKKEDGAMSSMIIKSREANDLKLTAYHGHFATRHSHNSHYLDITRMKHECAMANIAAASLANHYVYEKEIDTVVCLDGSEVIGTFLARQLSQKNLFSLSSEKNICVVAPEHDSNGLLIFRDNLRPMVSEKNVLLLISTVNSGKTAARALECIEYYGGTTQGVAAVFSALKQVGDIPVISLFSPEDIPGYVTSLVKDCPMCKAGQKIDALSNSYGFSPLT